MTVVTVIGLVSSGFVVGVDSSVLKVVEVVGVVSSGAIVDSVVTLDSGVTVVPVVCPGINVVGVDCVSGLSVVGDVGDVSPGLIVVSAVGDVCGVVISGFIVVTEVGDVCPGVVRDCCGGGVAVGVNVDNSGVTVVIVLEVVSFGIIVDGDSGVVVVAWVGVVCPGDCIGGVIVSSGFTVEEDPGFVVVTVVGVVCPGNC